MLVDVLFNFVAFEKKKKIKRTLEKSDKNVKKVQKKTTKTLKNVILNFDPKEQNVAWSTERQHKG